MNTLISVNGKNTYFNNDNTTSLFIISGAKQIYLNENMANVFCNCRYLQMNLQIFYSKVNDIYVTNMYSTYYNCYNLTGNLYMKSNNVKSTLNMLYGHNKLNKINIYCYTGSTTNGTLYINQVGCGA